MFRSSVCGIDGSSDDQRYERARDHDDGRVQGRAGHDGSQIGDRGSGSAPSIVQYAEVSIKKK